MHVESNVQLTNCRLSTTTRANTVGMTSGWEQSLSRDKVMLQRRPGVEGDQSRAVLENLAEQDGMNAASSRFPITVITITYNSAHCVARALTSAAGAAEFIIVDNASTDGSIGATEPFGCKVIANDGNVGFGVACNQAARLATSEFLLFLNPDAVLAPKAIERMLATAERFPNAVAFGPRHELPLDHEVDVTYQKRLARARNRGAKDQAIAGTREVRSLSGAALLCRRSTFAADSFCISRTRICAADSRSTARSSVPTMRLCSSCPVPVPI